MMNAEPNGPWGGRKPSVGQVAERSRTVTANDIGLFTEISGDRNPLHYDDAAARASRFGEIIVAMAHDGPSSSPQSETRAAIRASRLRLGSSAFAIVLSLANRRGAIRRFPYLIAPVRYPPPP